MCLASFEDRGLEGAARTRASKARPPSCPVAPTRCARPLVERTAFPGRRKIARPGRCACARHAFSGLASPRRATCCMLCRPEVGFYVELSTQRPTFGVIFTCLMVVRGGNWGLVATALCLRCFAKVTNSALQRMLGQAFTPLPLPAHGDSALGSRSCAAEGTSSASLRSRSNTVSKR
jgi:hypothetical protein